MEVQLTFLSGYYDRTTDQPTNQPTNRRTGKVIGKLHFHINSNNLYNIKLFNLHLLGRWWTSLTWARSHSLQVGQAQLSRYKQLLYAHTQLYKLRLTPIRTATRWIWYQNMGYYWKRNFLMTQHVCLMVGRSVFSDYYFYLAICANAVISVVKNWQLKHDNYDKCIQKNVRENISLTDHQLYPSGCHIVW